MEIPWEYKIEFLLLLILVGRSYRSEIILCPEEDRNNDVNPNDIERWLSKTGLGRGGMI